MSAHPLRDKAWAAILSARGHVQGKVFRMSRKTMAQLRMDDDQDFSARTPYFLYGVRVSYDEFLPFGQIELGIWEAERGQRW